MSFTGFTSTVVNGQQVISVLNLLASSGVAIDESIVITPTGSIRASGTNTISFLRCNIYIDEYKDASWFNTDGAPLSYNGDDGNRGVTTRFINFEDCQIIYDTPSITAIFISNAINSSFINKDAGSTLIVYTQEFAVLDGFFVKSANWEVNGQFTSAGNVRLDGAGLTNFGITRLDFPYISEVNMATSCTLGTGNSGNNSIIQWNRILFDNTTVNFTDPNGQYLDGITSSWLFQDRDNLTPVEDLLFILSSDISGSIVENGRYTTNSSGVLVGTYDSQFDVTGANQVRDTVFLFENYADQTGSSHGTGLSYDLIPVINQIEIRSYLHEAPSGYVVGDAYTLTDPQGSINSDFSTDVLALFTMNNDLNITQPVIATVLAYTDLGDQDKLFDRSKAEWRDNDLYALIGKSGSQLLINGIDLEIDATAVSTYTANTTSITAKAAEYTGGVTSTTGKLTASNGALLNGGTFICGIDYVNAAGTTITNVTHTGAFDFDTAGIYTLDGCTFDEITNSSGGAVTILRVNASTLNTNTGPNITIIQDVEVKNINLINLSRVQLYNVTQDFEIDNSTVSGGGGYSFILDLLGSDAVDGDVLRMRATQIDGVTAQEEYSESGIVTATGLELLGAQSTDPSYAAWALDGSLITKFAADYVSPDVDIILASDYALSEFGAWWAYNLTTTQGISDFFGGVTFVDEANILINNAIVNILLDNGTTVNVAQTDNKRLYRTDLTRPVKSPTTSGFGIDVEWRSPVVIANSDAIATIANQTVINDGVKNSSLIKPHTTDLPNA